MTQPATAQAPTLNLVPAGDVGIVWPLIAAQIDGVVARSNGIYTADALRGHFETGKFLLWLVWNDAVQAIGATQFYHTDGGVKIFDILFVTGEHSLEWLHLMDEWEHHARAWGCDRIEGTMRKGWAKRLPDWKMTHVTLSKDLAPHGQ